MSSNPARASSAPSPSAAPKTLDDLYRRVGFKIRRSHQIVMSLFEDQCGGLLTQSQFGALFLIRHRPGIDQIGLAKLIGHDRSTTALVVGKLERNGFIERTGDPADRRRKVLRLTPAGEDALARCIVMGNRVQEQVMSIFTPQEAEEFHRLLAKMVDAFNDKIRTPIHPEQA